MSDTNKADMAEKEMSRPATVSNGQTLETSTAGSHAKIKPRQLYMIAMGGKHGSL